MNNPLICDPETGVCEIPNRETETTSENTAFRSDKPIRVIYYTDPICSSCWGIEPQLRRLKLEYGHVLDFDYRMGGLLPDWSYNSGGISKPEDVAHHWDEVSRHYQMPIDGDVWLEDPLRSSYPPSIAFKAAQMQNAEKAISFLRNMRELLFLKKKNITKWENLARAAKSTGLDTDRLKQDVESGKANELFEQDLAFAKKIGVRGFPSIYFKDREGNEEFVYGSRPYRFYEEAIQKLYPEVQSQAFDTSLKTLVKGFGSLTPKEYSILSGQNLNDSTSLLEEQVQAGALTRVETKNGSLYRNGRL